MKKLIPFLFSCFFWLLLFFSIFLSVAPETTFNYNSKVRLIIGSLFPQGWEFFTISPQNEKIYFYKLDDNMQLQLLDTKNSSSSAYFGLSRKNRFKSTELSAIASIINDSAWYQCSKYIYDCYKIDTLKIITIQNKIINKTICGNWIVVKSSPLPWAWRNQIGHYYMPSKICRIKIKCSNENNNQ